MDEKATPPQPAIPANQSGGAALGKRTSFADERQPQSPPPPPPRVGGTADGLTKEIPKTLTSFRDEMATSEVKEGSITYARQAELPRLPIPTLAETMQKLTDVVLPALVSSPDEGAAAAAVVREFLSGPGPALQRALVEYDRRGYASGEFGSYVEEFWNESYLSPDSSVVLNLNPFFVLEGGVSKQASLLGCCCLLSLAINCPCSLI